MTDGGTNQATHGADASSTAKPRDASRRHWRNAGFLGLKLAVTLSCFWLISRHLDGATVSRLMSTLDPLWLLLAVALIAIEVPLFGERWRLIVHSLGHGMYAVPAADIQATNGFGQFIGQVLPNLAGDGARAIMLRGHGVTLAHAAWSVLLDRAMGVYLLFSVALCALLLPSGLEALGGYRQPILMTLALTTVGGTVALLLSEPVGRSIESFPRLRVAGTALVETHRALLGPNALVIFSLSLAVHALTILSVYMLGRSLGLALPLTDAAVLMACMIVVTLLPISIGGWGVREVATTALLTGHGASAEEAVVFSVAFGLVVMLATVPGALYWLFRRNTSAPA